MNTQAIFHVLGMQCNSCETTIENMVNQMEGIISVKANSANASVKINFDNNKISLPHIQEAITQIGYAIIPKEEKKQTFFTVILPLFILTSLLLLLLLARKLGHQLSLPEINSQTSNGMIFFIGLITGLHCIGMCGSFLVGYTTRDAEQNRPIYRSHLMYGAGKTLSYGIFGAIFGFVGSMFHITPLISGISIGLAGTYLILYGFNMLHIIPFLKAIRLKQSATISRYTLKKQRQSKNPFFIGLFSGFILGCGPLQAMYVMAAGNGIALEGAKFLVLFGLGTLPALLCFGMLTRLLSNSMTHRFIHASGIILIIMGMMMLQKGVMRSKMADNLKASQTKCHCLK